MISPDKVFEAAKRNENKNYKFRAFLKNHADETELDEQFSRLHNELFNDYDCSKCRNCCKMCRGEIPVTDVDKDAKYLNMSPDEFINTYLVKDRFGINYVAKHTPCDFYMDNGACRLGDCRPENCKDFPYTNKPERLWKLLGFIENVSVCPVAYEICERLKKEYNFK